MDPTTIFVVAIISATVTIVSLVLSIFGSAWLNQRNNERLLESLKNELKAEIQKLETKIDSIEVRVSRIERQLEQIFKPILK